MPEGPEVATIAKELQECVSGIVEDISYSSNCKQGIKEDLATLSVYCPLTIEKIHSKGKKLVMELTSPKWADSEKLYLVCGFGMTATWLYKEGQYTKATLTIRRKLGETPKGMVIYGVANIYYDDRSAMGNISVFSAKELTLPDVGPDILKGEITADGFYKILSDVRHGGKQICPFLLDQKYFSGIGNYVKCEALYHAYIHPASYLRNLTKEDVLALYTGILMVMQESLDKGGYTSEAYISPKGNKGLYESKVYARQVDSNGLAVVTATFADGRTTYWCPQRQRLGFVAAK